MNADLIASHSDDLYRLLRKILDREETFALATVISRSGSGPREAGASMLIDATGKTRGTVGGGGLEAQVIDLGCEAIREARSFCREFVLTSQQAADSGMICGGRMEVLVQYIGASDAIGREVLGAVVLPQAAGRSCMLIRSMRADSAADEASQGDGGPIPQGQGICSRKHDAPQDATPVLAGMGLLMGDRFTPGTLDLSGIDRELLKEDRLQAETILVSGGGVRYVIQPVGAAITVVIAGAGHLSRALSPLCRYAGFNTVILDDRAEFADRKHFPEADAVILLPSFEQCFRDMEIGADRYVVIVTRGHEHDRTVLAQALRTDAGYIGMIGSRRKRDAVYRSLYQEGFTAGDTARVRCPIGLAIGAQTPAEIAFSIAAELILVRSQKRNASTR